MEAKFVISSVTDRSGDNVTGAFLGTADSIAEAFRLLGEAIEKDQPDGKPLLYVIRNERGLAWTIIEPIGSGL